MSDFRDFRLIFSDSLKAVDWFRALKLLYSLAITTHCLRTLLTPVYNWELSMRMACFLRFSASLCDSVRGS